MSNTQDPPTSQLSNLPTHLPSASPPSPRTIELDGLRGLAALSVALGHCVTRTSPNLVYNKSVDEIDYSNGIDVAMRFLHIIFNADAAVVLFFVLSGHVLFASLQRKSLTNFHSLSPSNSYSSSLSSLKLFWQSINLWKYLPVYVVRRLFRIYPVVISSFVVFAFFVPWDLMRLIENMLLWKVDLNGVTWSLQVELIGSLIVFFTWVFLNAIPRFPLLMPGILIASCLWAMQAMNLFTYLPMFLMGCSISLYRNQFNHLLRPRSLRRTAIWTSIFIFLTADFLIGKGAANVLIVGIAATLIIAGIVATIHSDPLSPDTKLLRSNTVQFLGRVSYPFYLLHGAAIRFFFAVTIACSLDFKLISPFEGWALLAVMTCAVALASSWLIHIGIEKPGIKAGAWLTRKLNGGCG